MSASNVRASGGILPGRADGAPLIAADLGCVFPRSAVTMNPATLRLLRELNAPATRQESTE